MFLSKAKFVLPLVASAFLFSANADVITLGEEDLILTGTGNLWNFSAPEYLENDNGVHSAIFNYDISDIHSDDYIRSVQFSSMVYLFDEDDNLGGDMSILLDDVVIGSIDATFAIDEEFGMELPEVKTIELDATAIDWDQDQLTLTLTSSSDVWGELHNLDNESLDYSRLTVATPEPCTSVLIFMGLGLLGFFSRKKKIA